MTKVADPQVKTPALKPPYYAEARIEVSIKISQTLKRMIVRFGPFASLDLARIQLRTLVHLVDWTSKAKMQKSGSKSRRQLYVEVNGVYHAAWLTFVRGSERIGSCSSIIKDVLETPALIGPTVTDEDRPAQYQKVLKNLGRGMSQKFVCELSTN